MCIPLRSGYLIQLCPCVILVQVFVSVHVVDCHFVEVKGRHLNLPQPEYFTRSRFLNVVPLLFLCENRDRCISQKMLAVYLGDM